MDDKTIGSAIASAATTGDEFNSSLTEKAYRKLEEMLVTLELQPGQILTEKSLVETLRMSRTPLREALQRLALEGLVAVIPRKGVFVTDVDVRSQLELLRVRREIERLMARLAADRHPSNHKSRYLELAEFMDEIARAKDTIGYIKRDKELALMIAVDCRNEFAGKSINMMSGLSRRFWYQHYQDTDVSKTASLHAKLARAIAAGDADEAATVSDELSDYREEFTRGTLE